MSTAVRACPATVATTVKLTSTSAYRAHVVMGRGAWMESPTTTALAYQATLATTAKQTQMNAVLLRASTEETVSICQIIISVSAWLASLGSSIVKKTLMSVCRVHAFMESALLGWILLPAAARTNTAASTVTSSWQNA